MKQAFYMLHRLKGLKEMKLLRKYGNSRGMTLIEVIVSIAILGIIVIPVATVFIQSVNTAGASDRKLAAQGLAQRYLEGLKNNISITNLEDSFKLNFGENITILVPDYEDAAEIVYKRKVQTKDTGTFFVECIIDKNYTIPALDGSSDSITAYKITVKVSLNSDLTGVLIDLEGVRE